MNKEQYKEEIELIEKQNNTELEIYPMAVELIQSTTKDLSKRYVFARQKSNKGQIFYGLSSFPDVAILDKDFDNNSNNEITKENRLKLKGCIEIKALCNKLISSEEINNEIEKICNNKAENLNDDTGQLIGEILWYKKVLYTNGKEWRYLCLEEYTEELNKKIIETVNNRIEFENTNKNFKWWQSFGNDCFKITDKCITDDCLQNWDEFISEINNINWNA